MSETDSEHAFRFQLGDLIKYWGWYHRARDGKRRFWKRIEVYQRNKPNWSRGIFLGYRTLHDGERFLDPEGGYGFLHKGHKRCALVCYSETRNPVYVPLDMIQCISRPFFEGLALVKPFKDYHDGVAGE